MRNLITLPCHWSVLALGLLAPALHSAAQEPVRISDPGAIVVDVAQLLDPALTASMAGAGLDEETMDLVRRSSIAAHLPLGLRTASDRQANQRAILNMVAEVVAMHSDGSEELALLRIPANANYHMPEDLRSNEDLFLLVRSSGLSAPPVVRMPASPGPRWQGRPKARIVRADGLFATYDLSADPDAIAALERVGMSPGEIKAVGFRSHQRNWPPGLEDLERRVARGRDISRFKAYEAARWNGKRLIIVPAEQNRKLPAALRPFHDIYMVFEEGAVTVTPPKRSKRRR
jgi:hypothetical protein